MNETQLIERSFLRSDLPVFRPGDTVKVHVRVVEGNRERVQVFQGVVIRRQGGGVRETFTVRKISFGVGVERTFPVHSPIIAKIEFMTRGDVRRAKLYYLRERVGKRARVRERRYTGPEEAVTPGLVNDPAAALEAEVAAEPEAVDSSGETAEEVVDAGGAEDTAAAPEAGTEGGDPEAAAPPDGAAPAEGAEAEAEASAAGEPAADDKA